MVPSTASPTRSPTKVPTSSPTKVPTSSPTKAVGQSDDSASTSSSSSLTVGFVHNTKVFGHVHMPKTAGTEINGELAAHYERVCGHKGYSYDFVQFNKRVQHAVNQTIVNGTELDTYEQFLEGDSYGKIPNSFGKFYGWNRGQVDPEMMYEIGYENCDYISLEEDGNRWFQMAEEQHVQPLELHVPCRDPLNHLMSFCNHGKKTFDCSVPDLNAEIRKCFFAPSRFSRLLRTKPGINITLKCFNPIPIDPYLKYMDQFLQRKRVETDFIHRPTNAARNKSKECIWTNQTAQELLIEKLKKHFYFGWCNKCLGSDRELPLEEYYVFTSK